MRPTPDNPNAGRDPNITADHTDTVSDLDAFGLDDPYGDAFARLFADTDRGAFPISFFGRDTYPYHAIAYPDGTVIPNPHIDPNPVAFRAGTDADAMRACHQPWSARPEGMRGAHDTKPHVDAHTVTHPVGHGPFGRDRHERQGPCGLGAAARVAGCVVLVGVAVAAVQALRRATR